MTYEFPDVAILIITYDRFDVIKQTIAALQMNVFYPPEKLHYVITDDSTGGTYLSRLKKLKAHKDMTFISTPERGGWGKNVNWGLSYIADELPHVKYAFQIEDDYWLSHRLDLQAGIALLETMPHIGMLRYRGTSGDRLILHQFTGDISKVYPDFAESAGANLGHIAYLQIDSASPTAYIYSNGAHLKRLGQFGFHAFYGMYPEGRKLGVTEEAYAIRVKEMMKQPNAPGIAILPEWIPMHLLHMGKTWQGSEHDI